jgi:hypothetical protein
MARATSVQPWFNRGTKSREFHPRIGRIPGDFKVERENAQIKTSSISGDGCLQRQSN